VKRIAPVFLLVAAFMAACTQAAPPSSGVAGVFDGTGGQWVDLTYPFDGQSVYWPTARGFELDTVSYGMTEGGWFYSAFEFAAAEHGGTHMDAPIHFAEGRLTADRVPLAGLIGPAAVVDVSDRADADYLVSVNDLQAWEGRHGELPNGGILLLETGWGSRYGDRTAYLGTDLTGPAAVPQLHFPGLDPEAARWLVAERGVVAVGIDTPSIDRGQSATFDCHRILYAENIVGFENVANLDLLPEAGSYVVALPMKIEGGSGAPLRIVAFIPHA
jgi:kynurenine formamidase